MTEKKDINLNELAKHIIAAMFIFCSDVIIIKEIWRFGIVQKCFLKFCAMNNLLEMNFSGLMILITFGITAKIIFSTVPNLILWMFVLKKKEKNPVLEYLHEIGDILKGIYSIFLVLCTDVSFETFLYHRIDSYLNLSAMPISISTFVVCMLFFIGPLTFSFYIIPKIIFSIVRINHTVYNS